MSDNGAIEGAGSVMDQKDWLQAYDQFVPSIREFKEFIGQMPKQGIGLKCDTAKVARIHQRQGLVKPDNNYWILVPPTEIELSDAANFQEVLMGIVDYALVLTDPWRDQEQVRAADRIGFYSLYFKNFPGSRPAISWFTGKKDFFDHVNLDGEVVGNKVMGSVGKFGPIPKEDMGKPIILTYEDLRKAEKETAKLLNNVDGTLGKREFRRIMWHMAGGVMLKELMSTIISI